MTATERQPPLTLYDRLRLAVLLNEYPTLTIAEARRELGLPADDAEEGRDDARS